MNAVEVILRYVEVFRRFGIPVTFEPGWDARGNGQTANYQGAICHHTATPSSNTRPQALVTGRPDLSGPLCQFAGLHSGGVHVVAAHPANHAGASGGPSMGPLPVTRAFNPLVVGFEMVYPGTSPMSPEQYRTQLVYILATGEIFGSVERCRGHYETSIEGKPDPAWSMNPWRPYDMNYMRAEALTLMEDEVTPEQVQQVINGVIGGVFGRIIPLKQYPTGTNSVSLQGVLEYDDYRAQSLGAQVKAVGVQVNAIGTAVAALADKLGDVHLDEEQLNELTSDLTAKLHVIEDEMEAAAERQRADMLARIDELAERLADSNVADVRQGLREFFYAASAPEPPQG